MDGAVLVVLGDVASGTRRVFTAGRETEPACRATGAPVQAADAAEYKLATGAGKPGDEATLVVLVDAAVGGDFP